MGYFYLFLFIGLFYFYGPVFTSGWDMIPGSMLDSVLANYILEHIYLVFTHSSELHTSYFNMPIFYPIENTLAWSDTFFSIAPLYVFFRFLFDYSISYSMTVILISVLNFSVFYFILRKFKYSKFLSSLGAFLCTFSYNNKITHFHIQLLTQFFYLGMILTMLNISKYNSKLKNSILFFTASTLLGFQFYSSFYLGFYVYFITLIILIFFCCKRNLRRKLKVFCLRYKKEILISGVWFLVLIYPLANLYLGTGFERTYFDVDKNLPAMLDYFRGKTEFITLFLPNLVETYDIEKMLLLPYLITILGIIGLLRFKRYGKVVVAIIAITLLLVTKFQFLNWSFWRIIYEYLPGAKGIRETIRILLVIYPFIVLGFINFLKTSNLKKYILVLIVCLVIGEQYLSTSYCHRSYEKEQAIQEQIGGVQLPVNCKYLDLNIVTDSPGDIYSNVQEEMARVNLMWFASEHGFYLVTGYTGMAETDGFVNPYKEQLKKDPQYCTITRHIKLKK